MMGSLIFVVAVIFVAVMAINRSNRNARYKNYGNRTRSHSGIIISSQVPEPMRAALTKAAGTKFIRTRTDTAAPAIIRVTTTGIIPMIIITAATGLGQRRSQQPWRR